MAPVRCEVKGVFVTAVESPAVPLVLLSDSTQRMLPVFIGLFEAVSINSARKKEILPRPFTHDLFPMYSQNFRSRFTPSRMTVSMTASIMPGLS